MATPILRSDTPREIHLAEQRLGPALLFVACLGVAFGSRTLFPGSRMALVVFGAIGVWALLSLLRIHDLRLDLVQRRFAYRRGWIGSKPLVTGGFEALDSVRIEANEATHGPVASRLRSRLVMLRFRDWPSTPPRLAEIGGVFPLGFPMGPRVAAEKGADYATRLGIPLVDATSSSAD